MSLFTLISKTLPLAYELQMAHHLEQSLIVDVTVQTDVSCMTSFCGWFALSVIYAVFAATSAMETFLFAEKTFSHLKSSAFCSDAHSLTKTHSWLTSAKRRPSGALLCGLPLCQAQWCFAVWFTSVLGQHGYDQSNVPDVVECQLLNVVSRLYSANDLFVPTWLYTIDLN